MPEIPHARNVGVDISGEAYTTKTNNFTKMMMGLGHEVYRYGPPPGPNSPPCTEHVTIITREKQDEYFSKWPFEWDHKMPYWRWMNRQGAEEIKKRIAPKDFLCLIGGSCQKMLADEVGKDVMPVEIGIGYYGVFSQYRVYESHWHRAAVQATINKDGEMPFFDTVIPGYFDPVDFPKTTRLVIAGDDPYILFVGRIIRNKGIQIAIDTARQLKMKLIIAGRGGKIEGNDFVTGDLYASDISGMDVVYPGHVTHAERNSLMANAAVLMAPSVYGECFGNIVIEAGMFGTPSVTTNSGAFTETVTHGVTGYRAHTLRQFVDATEAAMHLDRGRIERLMKANYGLDHAALMYSEYFNMLYSLWGDGWYDLNQPSNIDWLARA